MSKTTWFALGASALVSVAAHRAYLSRHASQRVEAHRAEMESLRAKHQASMGEDSSAVLVNAQGLKLFVRLWSPEPGQPVRGLVLIMHGLTWHSGPFAPFARALAAQGLAVAAYDLQGHGLSDSFEGLRGYVRRFDDYVNDTVQVMGWAAARYPGAPVFLAGESMGGSVVLQALRRRPVAQRVRGAVLLAPGIRVSAAVLPPRAIMPVLLTIATLFPRVEVPDDKVIAPDNWKGAFGDSAFADAAYSDPLVCLARPRLNMLRQLPVWEDLWDHLEDIDTPLLVAHAPEDPRCEFANSEALVARAASTDKELLVAHGGRHMLLYDLPEITARVTDHLVKWVVARC